MAAAKKEAGDKTAATKKTYKRPKTPEEVIRYARVKGFTDAAKGRVQPGSSGGGGGITNVHTRFMAGAPTNRGDGLPDWAYKQGVDMYYDLREACTVEMVDADGTPFISVAKTVGSWLTGTEMTVGDAAEAANEALLDNFVEGGSSNLPEYLQDGIQILGTVADVATTLLD